ncbi:Protein held out wings [Portunus trituberculatus]|uniref:Protein held out wings n=1 Tax=Portunus trituberculatus TaxID=210409 RepID=A0A5B7DZV0_PORTR|nr:Protein held out wings [Portunus trituberculatus]
MGDSNTTTSIADYLAQLLKDKKQLAAFPSVFLHVERLLDEVSARVRLVTLNTTPSALMPRPSVVLREGCSGGTTPSPLAAENSAALWWWNT